MDLKKMFFVLTLIGAFVTVSGNSVLAQQRERVAKPTSSHPTNLPLGETPDADSKVKTTSLSRPVLTTPINIVSKPVSESSLVKKTASVSSVYISSALAAGRTAYGMSESYKIMNGIQIRFGKPYRYGATGPNSFDCSGFIFSVFNEAGIPIPRESARGLWAESEPVSGDERFKFGTLVFLNGLGHVGIVADENGFYHASSSKGIMYSPFKGYWSNRIVGFRRWKQHETPKEGPTK